MKNKKLIAACLLLSGTVALPATASTLGKVITSGPTGTITDQTPTFNWSSVADAVYYRVNVQTTSGSYYYLPEPLPNGTSYTPSMGLQYGECYNWWVRAERAIGDAGPWSNKRTVCVEEPLPDVVISSISISPSSPDVGDPVTITALIENIGNAVTPNGVAVGVGVQVDGQYTGSFFSPQLDPGDFHFGTINATWTATSGTHTIKAFADDINRFAESNENNNNLTKSVTVSAPLGAPSPSLPGSNSYDRTPTFSWGGVSNANYYRLSIRTSSGGYFINPEPLPSSTSHTITSSMSVGQCYDWYVRAERAIGDYGPWSTKQTVCIDKLGTPVTRTPSGTITDLTPNFDWDPVSDATDYNLRVVNWANNTVVNIDTTATNYTPPTNLGLGCHEWHVTAKRGNDIEGDPSPVKHFCIAQTNEAPTITLSSPNGETATGDYTIEWTDTDSDDNAQISLYFDNNNYGLNGNLITSGINEDVDGSGDQYVWDTSSVPEGNWYVYAKIDDGTNTPRYDYSPGRLTVQRPVNNSVYQCPTNDFERSATTASQLTTAVNDYGNSAYNCGIITISNDINLPAYLVLNASHDGLILTGDTDQTANLIELGMAINAYNGTSHGTIEVLGADNVVIKDLKIRNIFGAGSYGMHKSPIYTGHHENLVLSNLTLVPAPLNNEPPKANVALSVSRSVNTVIENVRIDGFYGTGILLRRVDGFLLDGNAVTNMNNAKLDSTPAQYHGSNAAIQIDDLGTGSEQSGNGHITGNTISNVPGQSLFVRDGLDVLIESNNITNGGIGEGCSSGVDCGGRGIYVQNGSGFMIRNNTVNGIDNGRSGGGINAANVSVENVIIRDNNISWIGNAQRASSVGAQTYDENGYGIGVYKNVLVENNTINDVSTYGVYVQPGASNVAISGNTIDGSTDFYTGNNSLNGIKVKSGYTYNGQYINDDNQPNGAVSSVVINDNNTIRDVKYDGILLQSAYVTSPTTGWNNDDAFFQVCVDGNQLSNTGGVDVKVDAPPSTYTMSERPKYYVSNSGSLSISGSAQSANCSGGALTRGLPNNIVPAFEQPILNVVCTMSYPKVGSDGKVTLTTNNLCQ